MLNLIGYSNHSISIVKSLHRNRANELVGVIERRRFRKHIREKFAKKFSEFHLSLIKKISKKKKNYIYYNNLRFLISFLNNDLNNAYAIESDSLRV